MSNDKETHNPINGLSDNAKEAKKTIDIADKQFEPSKPESSDKTKREPTPKAEPKEKSEPDPIRRAGNPL